MTEKQEILNETKQEASEKAVPDTLSSLFEERDRPALPPREEEKEEKALGKKTEKEVEREEPQEEKKKPDAEENQDDSPQEKRDVTKLKDELQSARKALQDTRNFGRHHARKVKTALKAVQNLIADGSLSEDEAQGVLASLQIDQEIEEEAPQPAASHPFSPIFKIVNNELQHLRKYTDDEHLDDKLEAFEYQIATTSKEESEEILESLMDLIEEPVKLTRKILSLGNEVYEDFYKEVKKAGGINNHILNLKKENEKLQKKIDKLMKEKDNQYDKPQYRLNEMGDTETESPETDTIGSLFRERDRPIRR